MAADTELEHMRFVLVPKQYVSMPLCPMCVCVCVPRGACVKESVEEEEAQCPLPVPVCVRARLYARIFLHAPTCKLMTQNACPCVCVCVCVCV
jgi:hypothetical protein